MKAVAIYKPLPIKDPEALNDIEVEKPNPNAHDLLVNVKAISVNPVDTKVRINTGHDPQQPRILGWDAVGVVVATGDKVNSFQIGDRVWYAGAIDRPGSNAEYQLVDERITGLAPKSLDDTQAAAIPLTAITAWELLFERLGIQQQDSPSDEVLLIIGAAGGVGSMLVQLAHQLTGATIIATASRDTTRSWVREYGADYIIDHRRPFQEQLRELGITHISHVASLTRTDLHLDEIVDVLQPFGKMAVIDDPGLLDYSKLKTKSISLHWELMFTRSLFMTEDMTEQQGILNRVANLVDSGTLRTTLSENYGQINASNLSRAHALLESGQSIGKIVLSGFQD